MKKLMNKKGFTLMEMLIVVAIIVILVAISVPTFTSSLGEAKTATDEANMRAAKAAAVVYVMEKKIATTATLYYNADLGEIQDKEPDGYGQAGANSGKFIKITYTVDATTGEGEYKYDWVAATPAGGAGGTE